MTPLEAALIFTLLVLPFHVLIKREFQRLSDPAYLRTRGVVVVKQRALEGHAAPIGTYKGQAIWESVTFMGMVYRFSRIGNRQRLKPRELYLEPGLVYLTD